MSSDELTDYLESLPKDEQERIKKSLDNKDKDDKTDKDDNNEKAIIPVSPNTTNFLTHFFFISNSPSLFIIYHFSNPIYLVP